MGIVSTCVRDGRIGPRTPHESARTASEKLCRKRPQHRKEVLEQSATRVLQARGGAVRLVQMGSRASFHVRERQSRRLGSSNGSLGRMAGPGQCESRITPNGKLTVSSATADIGTGTYTIMTQIAAHTLGLSIADVTFELGDSTLPAAPVEGGSFTAGSIGSAVKAVCEKVRK